MCVCVCACVCVCVCGSTPGEIGRLTWDYLHFT